MIHEGAQVAIYLLTFGSGMLVILKSYGKLNDIEKKIPEQKQAIIKNYEKSFGFRSLEFGTLWDFLDKREYHLKYKRAIFWKRVRLLIFTILAILFSAAGLILLLFTFQAFIFIGCIVFLLLNAITVIDILFTKEAEIAEV